MRFWLAALVGAIFGVVGVALWVLLLAGVVVGVWVVSEKEDPL